MKEGGKQKNRVGKERKRISGGARERRGKGEGERK